MKVLSTATIALTLLTSTAHANSQTAGDIIKILKDKAVRAYINSEDVGILRSIVMGTNYKCGALPTDYQLVFTEVHTPEGWFTCKKTVMVGDCDSESRNKVTMLEGTTCEKQADQ